MSFVHEPATSGEPTDYGTDINPSSVANTPNEVNFFGRSKTFGTLTLIFAVIGIFLVPVLPLSFAFSYLYLRNIAQAEDAGIECGNKFILIAPVLVLLGWGIYLGPVLASDGSGWGWLGVMIMGIFSLPAIIIGNIFGFFISRHLRKKDKVAEPRRTLLSAIKIIGVVLLIPAVLFFIFGGFSMMGTFI